MPSELINSLAIPGLPEWSGLVVALLLLLAAIAFLLISALPTLSWGKLRPRRHIRLEVIGLFGLVLGGGLLTETWWTLIAICAVYVTLLPVGMIAYSRVRRQRAAAPDAAG